MDIRVASLLSSSILLLLLLTGGIDAGQAPSPTTSAVGSSALQLAELHTTRKGVQLLIIVIIIIIIIKLIYIFLMKQEISEAYTNVPAKTHVNYFISMSVCRSVAHFCVRLSERTIRASDFQFAAKCRH